VRQDWQPEDRNGAAVTSLKRHSQGATHPADQLPRCEHCPTTSHAFDAREVHTRQVRDGRIAALECHVAISPLLASVTPQQWGVAAQCDGKPTGGRSASVGISVAGPGRCEPA
jgi:hypothetical protein